ncbi:twin-arginine translocase TatA/TatE family subunit [Magnetospirillum gryphiswaldense]|jgi:sec-independent protein translocase protein TatA|uniref:Sec-independent protein translocase protein TatA n=3 Tax=Magnetospirillum gryphiswaldense TaxID=55518 RepID=V6EYI6_MAGGM|nr:twin-arginine translocase TatA/TatE family subunit [Magnetospirillum gryphiswaldense]AVM73711.1 Sec-independent protein translocase protein TatA [Magnetospirillum gryphiswaldense MSR-1]AVM77614.1 Sec-independent protein translocase protein TatA [Magnetospirillum gryphiswaldense]CAM76767.1 Bacterial sec-independent translocation protein mttA/Hcf106 [Magnetospirillum gryphiswaldense MSR-1]CDK98259.1 Sec-independent protein translocase protein tatA/E homolog [Magnetospirillum gryphiswaldense MS
MGSFSIWHWLIVLVIVLLLFGAGKIPKLMGDMAKGVKAFKKGLNEEDEAAAQPAKPADSAKIEADAAAKPAEKDAARH